MWLAQNIGQAYKDADDQLKRYYLSLFFDGGGFFVKNRKIVKTKLSRDVKALIKEGSVRVRMNWLPLINAFRDEPLILHVPQYEIDMIRQYLSVASQQPIYKRAFVEG